MDGGRLDLVEGAIRLVGLQEQAHLPMDGLSQGMRQRLTLASAMLGSPDVLLLDEPYNGLDPAAARSLTRVLTRLAQRGVSVVISSHHCTNSREWWTACCFWTAVGWLAKVLQTAWPMISASSARGTPLSKGTNRKWTPKSWARAGGGGASLDHG